MSYCPKKGDIIWIDLDPRIGSEQKGRMPAIVLSEYEYNSKTKLAIICPITSKKKGYPFEVELNSSKVKGVILSDHIKSLDWYNRSSEFIEVSNNQILNEVNENINLIIS